MKKITLTLMTCGLIYLNSFSQTNEEAPSKVRERQVKRAYVDSSQKAQKNKTGSTKDIFQNLYQLGIQNLFGKNGELSLSSTLFGLLDSANNKIESSDLYSKFRWARNVSINIKGKLDSSNSKVESYGGGVKFAILNKRDITKFDASFNAKMKEYETKLGVDKTNAILHFFESNQITDDSIIDKKKNEIEESLTKFLQSKDVNDLDKDFLKSLLFVTGVNNPEKMYLKPSEYVGDWKKSLNEKPLWTFDYNLYHNIATKKDTSAFQTDFVTGFKVRPNKADEKLWELNLSSYLKLCKTSDSTNKTSTIFHFEAGLNKVLSVDENDKSQMEFKFFGSYDKDFAVNNAKGTVTANATYRYRIGKDFWIPVSLKYDPKKGNIFGYATLTFNLDKY